MRSVDVADVDIMLQSLAHRGPDGNGSYASGNVGIGMGRLAIFDAAPHPMPISTRDGRLHIAYNGEVYNYDRLSESGLTPNVKVTESDAAWVLEAWRRQGARILGDLNGMYAFAVLDEDAQTLCLARDKAGEKPLYYYEDGERIIFASEIKAILQHVTPETSNDLACYHVFETACDRTTMFKGIYAVEPGEMLKIDLRSGELNRASYWKIWDNLIDVPDDEDRIVSDLCELLEDAILLRTKNNCGLLGCLVSGGVDSALVACIAKPDHIYTGNYDLNDDFNELPYAQLVADQIGKELVVVQPTKQDFQEYSDDILWHLDMPATWTSFNWYMVVKRASEDIRVLLSGEGADELFGGYHRYHLLHHDQKIYELQAMEKYSYLIGKYYGSPASRYSRLINRNENEFDESSNRYVNELTEHYFSKFDGVISGMGATDFYTTMQVLLQMGDRMSMAFSVENRAPLLDHRLVQYAYSMPERFKINNGITKYIFKQVAAKFIPQEIADRKDKRGFLAPVNIWFDWGSKGKYSRTGYKDAMFDRWKTMFVDEWRTAR